MNKILVLLGFMVLLLAYTGIANASFFEAFIQESAILLLLGFVLVTLAGIGRKRFLKKKK